MFSKGSKSTSAIETPSDSLKSEGKSSGVPSIISPDLTITGNLKSAGDVQIDGKIEGDITSRVLTIGEGAQVQGALVAETVRVYGSVSGEIRATAVVLAKTARVIGDIAHQSLSIEAGAYLEGQISRFEVKPNSGAKVAVMKPGETAAPSAGGSAAGGSTAPASAVQAKPFGS